MPTTQTAEEMVEKCAKEINRVAGDDDSLMSTERLKQILLTELKPLFEDAERWKMLHKMGADVEPCGTVAQAMVYMSLLEKYMALQQENKLLLDDMENDRIAMEIALERLQRFQLKGFLASHDRSIAGLKSRLSKRQAILTAIQK